MIKYYKASQKYLAKHVDFNGLIHLLGGMGIGFLLAYPVAGIHPVRFGVFFLVLSAIGHIWAATQKP